MNHVRELLEIQDGVCAICMGADGNDLVVDHDHETGYIRGLLCHSCNIWEGKGYAPELLSYRLNHPAVGRCWVYHGPYGPVMPEPTWDPSNSYDRIMAALK